MARPRNWSFLIFSIFCASIPVQADTDNLHAIVDAVKQSLQFYANSYMHMNIDGIFGLRIVEGQLALIIEQLELYSPTTSRRSLVAGKQKNFTTIVSSLNSMRLQALNISQLAQTALQRNDEPYYNLMQPLIHRPWRFAKEFGNVKVKPELKWQASTDKNSDTMPEELSDKCIGQLMGTVGGGTTKLCSISSECISVMSMSGRTGYHLTHQLLYGIIAEQYGCLPVLNLRLGPAKMSIEKLRSVLCTNNFYEVSSAVIKDNGRVSSTLDDLFMEQEFVCPNLGYVEFLHSDWLQQILSWQKPSGCWGLQDKIDKWSNNAMLGVDASETELKDVEQLQVRGLPVPRLQSRKLLYELTLNDGCLAHKTAVAVGCLMQYMRFILLSRFVGLDANEYLHGVNYLMNPNELTKPLSTTLLTQPENVQLSGRLDLLEEDNNYSDDKNEDEMEKEEAERDNQPRQADYQDMNGEIELSEDDSVLAKNAKMDNKEVGNAYRGDIERGIRVKYRSNNRLDAVASSLTSLSVLLVVIMVLFIGLLLQKFHCRLHRLVRLRRLCRL